MSVHHKLEIQHGETPSSRRPHVRLGLAVILFFLIATGNLLGDQPATNPVARSAVHALARLEPATGLVMVGARPGARILKIEVQTGDLVKAGDLVAVLEGNGQASQQVDLAVAQKKRALEQRSRARQKATLEREQTDTVLDLRRETLTTQVQITKEKNDKAQGAYTALSALGGIAKLPPKDQIEIESALYMLQMQSLKSELELKELEAKKSMLAKQRELEDQELKDGGAEDALLDRQIEVAKAALEQTLVKAPSPGTILAVDAHAGEASTGQLFVMGELSSIVARAEVDQSDVGKLRVGDAAQVNVGRQPVAGKITTIGGLVGHNQMRSVDPRAAQDLRVVQVTIRLDEPDAAARFIGMQVEVEIEAASKP